MLIDVEFDIYDKEKSKKIGKLIYKIATAMQIEKKIIWNK